MIKTKEAFFLEGRILSNQSEQLKKCWKSSDWLEKIQALQKSDFCFDHVNRLFIKSGRNQRGIRRLKPLP